jgi:hypothetical protein
VIAAALAFPATAAAGTYEVYACAAANTQWDNRSWTPGQQSPAGIAVDTACPKAGDPMALTAGPGPGTPDAAEAALVFRAPAGTTIADFRLNRRLIYNNGPVEGAHAYYATYTLGALVFAGAGDHPRAAALTQQKSWYGNPSDTGGVVSKHNFPALQGYKGDATYLSIRVGCAAKGTPCRIPDGGQIQHRILGAALILTDSAKPDPTVAATGLLAGGQRQGSDPVTVTATDASGIRRVEIIDVSDPAAPQVVGFEEYDPRQPGATLTDARTACTPRLAKPCPNLSDEIVAPTSLQPGRRKLVVRTHDVAGNFADSGPFDVDVVSPSDRGAPNGTGATDTATITASFGTKRLPRTVSQNERVKITGRLVNASGTPIANAILRVLTRDLHRETSVDRGAIVTAADGTFTYTATAYASRQIQFGWLARQRDTRFAANTYLTLKARARSSLKAPRSVRVGRTFTISGKLEGLRPSRVPALIAQGRSGRGRYQTFRLGRATTRGTFRLRYRFRDPASRGRTFSIRVRILPRGGWPYEDGITRTVRIRVR